MSGDIQPLFPKVHYIIRLLILPIEPATGRQTYFVGKPNLLTMRIVLKRIGIQREDTIIIGDRMNTDIVAGIEAEIDTCLVLSGISNKQTNYQ